MTEPETTDDTAPGPGPRRRRGIVSFVRRTPRLTPQQQRLWDKYADRWLIEVHRPSTGSGNIGGSGPGDESGHPNSTSIDPDHGIDLDAEFGRSAPLIVEIGPGMGESLVPMAAARPEWNVLAFEVFRPAIARILAKIDRSGTDNVRVIQANAVEGITHLTPEHGVDELWMFFPDPWHKTKHRKRRLVSPAFADLVATRLRPGGVWRLATDWSDYAKQMRSVLGDHPEFESLYPGDYAPRWEDRPVTKFEQRGVDAGRQIFELAYRRRG